MDEEKKRRRRTRLIEHFQGRLKERYGIKIQKRRISVIVNKIEKGDAIFIGEKSPFVKVYDVIYMGSRIRLMYSEKDKLPATALRINRGITYGKNYVNKL